MKVFFKYLYLLIICILALPFAIVLIIAGKLGASFGFYTDVSVCAGRIPFLLGEITRYTYYKATLKSLGKKVKFKYGSFCQYPTAQIGSRVLFGYYNAIGEVIVGDDVVIGGFVNFISGTNQHSFDDPSKTISAQSAPGRSTITIGSDVWIGSNAVITASIGNRCVIGAGSVVVKPVEDKSVYAGNPARLIKNID